MGHFNLRLTPQNGWFSHLPGMMTGMIIADVSPINAIMYQILVFFMMMSTAAMTSVAGVYLTYGEFFTTQGQLKVEAQGE